MIVYTALRKWANNVWDSGLAFVDDVFEHAAHYAWASLVIVAITFTCFSLTGCTVQPPSDCPGGVCPRQYSYAPEVVAPESLPTSLLDAATAAEAVSLPTHWQPKNWTHPTNRQGSCVHASMVAVLQWQGQHTLADWWQRTYAGGETATQLIAKATAARLRFAYTRTGDAQFLDWCDRTRRPCVIFYKPRHAIVFLGWSDDGRHAVLIDNNRPDRRETVERSRFLSRWVNEFGGFAFTVVYRPTPPAIS